MLVSGEDLSARTIEWGRRRTPAPAVAITELGHTDPTFTMRVYRHGMRRDLDAKAKLRELVGATEHEQDEAPTLAAKTSA